MTQIKKPRRVVATFFSTLDGVVENPAWTAPYWNDEIAAFKGEETRHGQELLLGRVTYEQFAQAWPQQTTEESGGTYFNPVRKHVVSATRTKDIWENATFLAGDLRKEVEELKAQKGGDLVVHGSITLARDLLAEGLVDELRLLVYPVVLGEGRRLFGDGLKAALELTSSQAMSNGVVALTYQPKEASP